MRIQPNANFSDGADEFATDLRKSKYYSYNSIDIIRGKALKLLSNLHIYKSDILARLTYPRCHATEFNQDEEHKVATEFFVTPDSIQYYQISPDYFYSAKNLRLRVCMKLTAI
jgi:hypothetical protein